MLDPCLGLYIPLTSSMPRRTTAAPHANRIKQRAERKVLEPLIGMDDAPNPERHLSERTKRSTETVRDHQTKRREVDGSHSV